MNVTVRCLGNMYHWRWSRRNGLVHLCSVSYPMCGRTYMASKEMGAPQWLVMLSSYVVKL
jgi:hypothetical protein